MRADRLVAVLLLLQARGRVTAPQVAAELEVSERTARRDLEALSLAGVPVYSQPGRNGGWQLAGGGRIDLSGLTAAEARALFLLAGPASLTPPVKAAFRKLLRALPEPLRGGAEAAATRVLVDGSSWDRPASPAGRRPPLLDAVQLAVIEGEELQLAYAARDGRESTRLVQPLGLAAKGAAWYLIAGTEAGLRTFRVDRVRAAVPTGRPAQRPDGFDLEATWRTITDELDERRAPVRARAVAPAALVPWCRSILGTRLRIGPAGPDGHVELELRGHSARSLASEIAGLAAHLHVVDPPAVRDELARLGADLVAVYAASPGVSRPRRRPR